MLKYRTVEKVFTPKIVSEGEGAKVRRIIGGKDLDRLDPFLMLDHGRVKLPAGFPDHPHRGFETVSYQLEGSFLHEDSNGHKGRLNPGDIQWMTAGKGIVHAEMPASKDEEASGLQLWINLENKNRMVHPAYQEFTKDKIPVVKKEGVTVKVIAGEAYGTEGPIIARTPAFYMDVSMNEKSKYSQKIPSGWNVMCYVLSGKAVFGSNKKEGKEYSAVLIKNDDSEVLEVETGEEKCNFILLAGKPIGEKIYQHGPFVLGTQAELEQAFEDYELGLNGFEGARDWVSEISKLSNS